MKHFLNFKIRTIYFTLLAISFYYLANFFNIYFAETLFLFLVILFLLYYLFDISNFDSYKVNYKKIIYSLFINFIIFFIIFLIFANNRVNVIYFFLLYSVIQITLKYFLAFFNKKHISVAILGIDSPTGKIIEILNKNNKFEYVGYIDNENSTFSNYLGKIESIEEIVKENNIQEIIFTSRKVVKKYADLIVELKLKGITIVDYLGFLEKEEGKVDIDKVDSLWILMTDGFTSFDSNFQKKVKRVFDIIISIILLIISFPFMIFTFILVKKDGGPAFFKQKRIGMNGKEFEIIKFRSMKVHDPSKFSKYASEDDDRITKVGHFIRKTRLDELPQLINVFRGDMSFVGPRPEWNELGHDYEKKIKNYHLRYAVRPGITGWAQTMYFYSSTIEEVKEKLEYDLYYIKYQDLFLDIVILFKTVKIVIFGKGI